MKKFEPFLVRKDGTLTYRFVYKNKKISDKLFSKTLSFRQKPSQRTLVTEYWKWREKIERRKIEKDSEKTMELFDYYLSQKKDYHERHKYNINKVRLALSHFEKIKEIKKADCYQMFEHFKIGRKDVTAERIQSVLSAFLSW